MGYRLTKGTLGQQSGDGVLVAKNTFYPNGAPAVASTAGAGTEAAPVVSGASQLVSYEVSVSEPSGAASAWKFVMPAGKWRLVDAYFTKGTGTGGAGDSIVVKTIKSGTTGAAVFTLALNAVAIGGIARATTVLTTAAAVVDASLGDLVEVTVNKGTTSATGVLRLSLLLEA